jgi:hypothetical protein
MMSIVEKKCCGVDAQVTKAVNNLTLRDCPSWKRQRFDGGSTEIWADEALQGGEKTK